MVTRQYDDIILADIDENLQGPEMNLCAKFDCPPTNRAGGICKKKKKKILCNVIFTVFGLGINLFCIVNYKFDEYDISLVDFLSQTIIVSCYRLHFFGAYPKICQNFTIHTNTLISSEHDSAVDDLLLISLRSSILDSIVPVSFRKLKPFTLRWLNED